MLTATAGFRHDAIPVARQVVLTLATASVDFTVTATEQLAALNAASLGDYDVLLFALTSGEFGHFPDTWTEPGFGRQLLGAIRWAAPR